jgi:hypothetical protein
MFRLCRSHISFFFVNVSVACGDVWWCVVREREMYIPLIRSIQEATLIGSLVFIIFSASSSSTSPVNVSSTTSIYRSCSGNRRLEESFCMLILPLNASSMTMHPRSAYEMLSFQKDRYPYIQPH